MVRSISSPSTPNPCRILRPSSRDVSGKALGRNSAPKGTGAQARGGETNAARREWGWSPLDYLDSEICQPKPQLCELPNCAKPSTPVCARRQSASHRPRCTAGNQIACGQVVLGATSSSESLRHSGQNSAPRNTHTNDLIPFTALRLQTLYVARHAHPRTDIRSYRNPEVSRRDCQPNPTPSCKPSP